MNILGLLGGAVQPLIGLFQKKQEGKQLKATLKNKLAIAKQDGETNVTLTDAEWESVNAGLQNQTWKDEYVTVSLMSIFNLWILGGIMSAFGKPTLLEGVNAGIQVITAAGIDLNFLLTAVTLAAIGLKVWRA